MEIFDKSISQKKLMRCFFILAAFLLMGCSLRAQSHKKKIEDREIAFIKVDIMAGTNEKAWTAYLKNASVLPAAAAADIPSGTYTVTVRFTVNSDGNVVDIKAKNNPGYGLAARAETLIGAYEGSWKPASQCGRNVNSYKEQEIRFVIGR
jgi:hypothetical protein